MCRQMPDTLLLEPDRPHQVESQRTGPQIVDLLLTVQLQLCNNKPSFAICSNRSNLKEVETVIAVQISRDIVLNISRIVAVLNISNTFNPMIVVIDSEFHPESRQLPVLADVPLIESRIIHCIVWTRHLFK